ncbi:glyoxylate reductase/hydroxypyruvate reductase-like [Cylas formicarius]|uniref:glyoxylate reductase/hydroxypyruvate reductase-like n=1 Tax=Cylas formicarius TaxID=197179 RepID=UPI0029586AD6|nr:glyoxylate reductase/hydroxypyruvate reductase-like [Cylas formicarius]
MIRSGIILFSLFVSATQAEAPINMTRPKVLISNPSVPAAALELLKEKCDLIVSPSDEKNSILNLVEGVEAIFWATHVKLDNEIIEKAGAQLKLIASMSAGYNHVDLKELKKRGIKLSNTPGVLSNAVADIAMLLALGTSRRLTEGRFHIERGTWGADTNNTQWMLGTDLEGSTVGIVGLGGIGQAIAKRLKGFDVARILYTGHREKSEGASLGAQFVDLDVLTKESDFIFLSAPLTNETMNMCNGTFFSKMRRTAILINVSRGQLVDQAALIGALKEGQIFAVGLDVMVPEPLPIDSELLKLPNVVLTPHLGSATVNTRNAMAQLTAKNILLALEGEELLTPVKF